MGRTNRASGNDRVAIQVGEVKGSKTPKPAPTSKDTPAQTENIRSGNAKVGRQVDEIRGDFTIRW
ncbi:hypothetical protein AB0C19_11920 [Micromonospora sp. NPDC048842]|uniref:hypothetical protein n=1 Tax=Micromonospora sp. NPDC048842 TaxID=3154346 RepID=UPI0033D3FF3D